MLFNSLEFFLFLPIVFILYWWVFNKSLKAQNVLILIASYVFYGWWDWRFLFLIAFSTVVDYLCGLSIHKAEKTSSKKLFLGISLFTNLGLLVFFKYFNFFIESWIDAWAALGYTMHASTLNVILPVGISFYTFQTLSYSIDIYRGTLKPTKDIVAFSAFVSFFPQLVAGPIERASELLPQIIGSRFFSFKQSTQGLRLIMWGLFKKIVIADNCAPFINQVYGDFEHESGATLVLSAILFSFQIYCDFSGYSDIAIGTAKLFGIELMSNFRFPYFSRDISEFWRRWHISLSTWFRDYLYIPLGGSRVNKPKAIRNIFAIFVVSGFWHGANWTFIFWGLINAFLFLPLFLFENNKKNVLIVANHSYLPSLKNVMQIIITFSFITIAWIFFRSENLFSSFKYIERIFTDFYPSQIRLDKAIYLIPPFVLMEWLSRKDEKNPLPFIGDFYFILIFALLIGQLRISFDKVEFIYFQF